MSATPQQLPGRAGEDLRSLLAAQPFCEGLDAQHVAQLATDVTEVTWPAGAFLLRQGHDADALYLLLEGDVALEVHDAGYSPRVIETLHAGDPVGWSWLFPPRTWRFDARCRTEVRALRLPGEHLRDLAASDAAFGRDLALRVGRVVVERLHHARAQLVSVHRHDRR